jgi:CRISPR-associated protein Cmr3
MELRFNPFDPLFFRNGRPFTAGEETWADSIFPPNPSVLYGALRTALATVKGKEIRFDQINERLSTEEVKVLRLYYFIAGKSCYSLPFDYLENAEKPEELVKAEKKQKEYTLRLAQPIRRQSVITSSKSDHLEFVFKSFDLAAPHEDGIFSEDLLFEYLQNERSEIVSQRLRDFIFEEPKVGIGRSDYTRTADEGLLYRVGMQRLKDILLGMTVRPVTGYSASDLNNTIVRLGGESKVASIASVGETDFQNKLINIKLKPGYFKLYFATPAIINNSSGMPSLGIDAKLVAAIVGKPIFIGGYDMVKNKPKMMYKAIPAGSVFYYQTSESPDAVTALQGQSFSDERKAEGFGISYFGNFTPPSQK